MKHKKKSHGTVISAAVLEKQSANRWMIPVIILLTFAVFYPALNSEMINTWDDGVYITENNLTLNLTAENIKRIFSEPISNNYNPLPILTFALIRSQVGLDPFLYHLVNILLHMVCVFLVFRLANLLDKRVYVAFAVALLFAVHPMRVESVAWITELKDVMFAAFYFLTLIVYINWLRSGRKKHILFLVMLIFATLSLLSKIQAVSLPLSMLVIDYFEKRQWKIGVLLEKTPFFLLSAVTGILGIYFLKEGGSFVVNEVMPLFDRILLGFYSLGNYFVKLLAPVYLSAYYPYPEKTNGYYPYLYYITPFIIILGVALIIVKFRSHRVLLFSLFFFLVNIIFVLQIVGAGKAYLADRFTYVAYFGLFFAIAHTLIDYLDRNKKKALFIKSVFFVYLILLSILTYERTKAWENSGTLWTDCINKYPEAFVAYDNRGVYYRSLKENDKALADYSRVLMLNPNYALSYNNRGNIYYERNHDELALADYNRAISLDPSNVKTFTNRAVIHVRSRNYKLAELDFEKALNLDSSFEMIYYNRGLYYDQINQSEKAVVDYKYYLKIKPRDDGIHNAVGVSYQKLNQHKNAIEYFNTAIKINPGQPLYWQNRSLSSNSLGDRQSAISDIVRAQQMGLKVSPDYLNHLGLPVK